MAKSKVKRAPQNQPTLGSADIDSATYNGRAGARKSLGVGPEIRVLPGTTQTSAFTAATALQLPPGTSLMLYNNSSSVAWVTTYQAANNPSPTTPAGFASGIAIPANAYLQLNMGEADTILASASTVGIYIVEDDTSFQLNITP